MTLQRKYLRELALRTLDAQKSDRVTAYIAQLEFRRYVKPEIVLELLDEVDARPVRNEVP
jgi:hypothetical protein